ncbi:MAG: trypsin-like peptidase domain-containing protein [Elusimicrobiota bacterium]
MARLSINLALIAAFAAAASVSVFAVDWNQDPLVGLELDTKHVRRVSLPQFPNRDVSLPDLVEKLQPSVVKVLTGGEIGWGTGFIVDRRGYLVTNANVTGDCERIQIQLSDGSIVWGVVVALQIARDLALIKIESTRIGWPALALAEGNPRPGQRVVTLGYPAGLGFSVAMGIVSGLGRHVKPREGATDRTGVAVTYTQTDAALNRGGAGGPLVDMAGRVVGVNTMIISQVGESNGLGLAITAADVKAFLDDVLYVK